MRDRMESALGKARADYTEIRIERSCSSWINFRGAELDSIGSSTSLGGFVRALVRGGWGFATFNNVTELDRRVEEACDCARLVGSGRSSLAPVEPVVDRTTVALQKDFRGIPLEEKKRVVEEYNEIARTYHPRIQSTGTGYSDRFREVFYANSEGSYLEDQRPDIRVSVSATARDGSNTQRGFEAVAAPAGFETVEGRQDKAVKAAERAVALLSAEKVRGGSYTVVLDPKLAGVFAHEAFGHLSEADHVFENPKLLETMVLGRRFGPQFLTIYDDGSIPGRRGTHRYDDEGVRTRRNDLIREGVLVGRLHSRETAGKMGESVTGNARAISYPHEPIVRMTNTIIAEGETPFEEMIADIEEGVYAIDMFGGQTMLEMFTFSAACGYMIRHGKVAELVRDVVLTGNVFTTLAHVEAVGNDNRWSESGGCGKGGQSPLPVTMAAPHLRIGGVVVGGAQ